MAEPNWKRTVDGLETRTPNGTASVSETPEGLPGFRWTLHINGTFQGTFPTESDAINAAEEILSLPK